MRATRIASTKPQPCSSFGNRLQRDIAASEGVLHNFTGRSDSLAVRKATQIFGSLVCLASPSPRQRLPQAIAEWPSSRTWQRQTWLAAWSIQIHMPFCLALPLFVIRCLLASESSVPGRFPHTICLEMQATIGKQVHEFNCHRCPCQGRKALLHFVLHFV